MAEKMASVAPDSIGAPAACTCRLGPDAGAGAVLDLELRMRGIGGLRLADAPVMPRMESELLPDCGATFTATGSSGQMTAIASCEHWKRAIGSGGRAHRLVALLAGQSAVGAVLEPAGLPAAVDHVGCQASAIAALTGRAG